MLDSGANAPASSTFILRHNIDLDIINRLVEALKDIHL